MAVTVINLSDPVSTLVTKSNTIASDLGDRATLGTTATSNLVAAINEINTKVVAIDTTFKTKPVIIKGKYWRSV